MTKQEKELILKKVCHFNHKETNTMNCCPKCQSKAVEKTRLDDNVSYQWVPAVHCVNCGWYGYPLASDSEIATGKVNHSFPHQSPNHHGVHVKGY